MTASDPTILSEPADLMYEQERDAALVAHEQTRADTCTSNEKEREEYFAFCIEEGIRPLVLHLRACGLNTIGSCHHNMSISFAAMRRHDMYRDIIWAIRYSKMWLREHGYEDEVTAQIDEVYPGYAHGFTLSINPSAHDAWAEKEGATWLSDPNSVYPHAHTPGQTMVRKNA